MQTFVVKLASGVAALIASICLSICNLSNNTETLQAAETAASSVFGLRMTMTVFPIIGLLIALAVFGKKYGGQYGQHTKCHKDKKSRNKQDVDIVHII